MQAIQQGFDDKFNVAGGTVAGTMFVSTALYVNGKYIDAGLASTQTFSGSDTFVSTVSFQSSGTVYTAGYPNGFMVIVSSNINLTAVGGSTVTIPVSTGTYQLEFYDFTPTVDTELIVRFNNGTSGYLSNVHSFENAASVANGGQTAYCHVNRETVAARSGYPVNYTGRIQFRGNMASVRFDSNWHQAGQATTNYRSWGTCEYSQSGAITNINVQALTGGGQFVGTVVLFRLN